jgi:hypothetical protein
MIIIIKIIIIIVTVRIFCSFLDSVMSTNYNTQHITLSVIHTIILETYSTEQLCPASFNAIAYRGEENCYKKHDNELRKKIKVQETVLAYFNPHRITKQFLISGLQGAG